MINEIRRALRDARTKNLLVDIQRQQLTQASHAIKQSNEMILTLARSYVALAIAWRVALDEPEIDVRDALDQLIQSSLDDIAKLEEQVIV